MKQLLGAFILSALLLSPCGRMAIAQQDSLSALELRARSGALSVMEWIRLAEARRSAGDTHGALEAAKSALRVEPRSTDARLCHAQMLASNGACTEAKEEMEPLLRETPSSFTVLMAQAGMLLACDSAESALVPLLRARELRGDQARVALMLGDTYARMGVNELAIRYYEEARTTLPADVTLHERLAGCYLKDQRYGDAAAEYERALAIDSTSSQAMLMLGKLLFAGKRYDRSAPLLSRYLTRHPDARDVQSIRLDALALSGRNEDAYRHALLLLELDASDSHARRIAGRSAYVLGRHQEARTHFLQLEENGQLDCEYMMLLARSERALSMDSLSIARYRQVLACDSGNTAAMSEAGSLMLRMRRYDEAMAVYQLQADVDTVSAAPMVNLSLAAMALGHWYEAETYLRTALQRKSDHIPAHVHLGRCLLETDSTVAAAQEFATAIALYDSSTARYRDDVAEAYALSGWLYMQRNNGGEALHAFDRSLSLRPGHVATMVWKGQTLQALGKRGDANAVFKSVLAIDPGNADARRGLQGK